MTVSVIIPTHNRRDRLLKVLRALEAQQGAPSFETIVVDDGSQDGTADVLANASFAFPLSVLSGPARGPAAARNRGVERARGEWVAFLGDDVIPRPQWLARHWQARGDHAVLGFTDWHPDLPRTPFTAWLNEQGKQFGYALIQDGQRVPYCFFYSSNLSLPHARLEPFCEEFPDAAWEDVELGYRLMHKGGLELVYCRPALAWHDHPTSVASFARRQVTVGRSACRMGRLHPELRPWLRLPPRVRWQPGWGGPLLVWLSERLAWPWLWERMARWHYREGVLSCDWR